jgi:hypothetical protein
MSERKKMGRPRLENPNSVTQTFTTSGILKKEVEKYALKNNVTVSSVLRAAVRLYLDTNPVVDNK